MTSMSMASYRLNDMLVSTMLARRENELHARQDSLTGLLNRHGLFGALDIAVRNAGHGQAEYAVLYLDLTASRPSTTPTATRRAIRC